MTITSLNPPAEVWDRFVATHPQAHILQLPAWGTLKFAFGWRSSRVALATPDRGLAAGAQLLYRPLPYGLGTLAYLPKGPLAPADWWAQPERTRPLWAAIHAEARQHRARWLKVEGPDADPAQAAALTAALEAARFRPSPQTIQPVRTVVIDLDSDPEAILARMKQKTRYNIRLSAKKGVTVRRGTEADIASFTAMMQVTGERDAFGVHDPAYYQHAYELFAPEGRAALFIGAYKGQDLAGVMAFALGDTAWYFYGASTNVERNRMPTYGVQWAAIQWAQERGCSRYDLWGVPDAEEEALEAQFTDRSDGLWGVYRTKRGWGGEVVRRLPAWDYIYNPLVYALYQQVLRLTGRRSAAP